MQRAGKARMISNLAFLVVIFRVTERQALQRKGKKKKEKKKKRIS